MTVAEAVIARLEDISAVTALVGTRIYQMKLPQPPTFPAIRVQRIGTDEFMHLRGSANVYRSRVQVDSVSSEATTSDPVTQANSVDDALHGPGDGTAMCGWTGTFGSPAFLVLAVLPASLREGYDAEELRQFKVMRDYFVYWSQG